MLVTANIFQPLIDVFEAVLKAFHSVGFSWGWSIVLLTIVIRAALLPLAVKQFHSMRRLQSHMPEMKAIQVKYKDDKQRQQQELMKFYKENSVNPFGSCLPMAAQIPVFISLFYMCRSSLRHDICPDVNRLHAAHTVACGSHGQSSFLFIPDLTNKTTGAVLIVLMVLYVGTMLGSSLLMMKTSTQSMDRNQRILMLAMPLVFTFVVIGFPAGVLMYWITTNTWTMVQQYVIVRKIGPMPVTTPAGRGTTGDGAVGAKEGVGTGLGALIRGRAKADSSESQAPANGAGGAGGERAAPPPPPRKKKKRSGRRR